MFFFNETSIDYRREFFRHILFEKSFLRQIHLVFLHGDYCSF